MARSHALTFCLPPLSFSLIVSLPCFQFDRARVAARRHGAGHGRRPSERADRRAPQGGVHGHDHKRTAATWRVLQTWSAFRTRALHFGASLLAVGWAAAAAYAHAQPYRLRHTHCFHAPKCFLDLVMRFLQTLFFKHFSSRSKFGAGRDAELERCAGAARDRVMIVAHAHARVGAPCQRECKL